MPCTMPLPHYLLFSVLYVDKQINNPNNPVGCVLFVPGSQTRKWRVSGLFMSYSRSVMVPCLWPSFTLLLSSSGKTTGACQMGTTANCRQHHHLYPHPLPQFHYAAPRLLSVSFPGMTASTSLFLLTFSSTLSHLVPLLLPREN